MVTTNGIEYLFVHLPFLFAETVTKVQVIFLAARAVDRQAGHVKKNAAAGALKAGGHRGNVGPELQVIDVDIEIANLAELPDWS